MEDEVSKIIREYDAAHPYWRQEKREREIKEAQEAEQRAHKAQEARRRLRHENISQVGHRHRFALPPHLLNVSLVEAGRLRWRAPTR